MIEVNIRKLALTGIILMIAGFLFAIAETFYFGSNFYPASRAELTCDYLSALVCGSGGGLYLFAIIIKVKNEYKNRNK